jgi:ParB family transcriptional regulator, chromosome partitioning protein
VARHHGGLGRGLAFLIDPSATPPTVVELEPDRIVASPSQPRRRFDEAALAELTRSVKRDGIVQPVVVRCREDGLYELIAGERRWRAACAAGLERIPALVRNSDPESSALLGLIENVMREDLGPIEMARGYAFLVDRYALSAAGIAERVGKSRTAVANTLRLLELPDDVLELLETGSLSEGHGRAVLMATDDDARRAIARHAASSGLSVRQTEALAARQARRTGTRPGRRPSSWLDPDLMADTIDAAHRAFGLPVRFRPVGRGARLEFVVDDRDALLRLTDRLDAVAGLAETHIL